MPLKKFITGVAVRKTTVRSSSKNSLTSLVDEIIGIKIEFPLDIPNAIIIEMRLGLSSGGTSDGQKTKGEKRVAHRVICRKGDQRLQPMGDASTTT